MAIESSEWSTAEKRKKQKTSLKHLFNQIMILRDLVEHRIRDAIEKKRFVRQPGWCVPKIESADLKAMDASFKALKRQWYAFMKDRIPEGGPRRAIIDDLFEDVYQSVCGVIPFQHKARAKDTYRHKYLTCFDNLERLTEELTRTCILKKFWREQEKAVASFRRNYGLSENVFVSVNYGDVPGEYPVDVQRIRELLENIQRQTNNEIRFHYPRESQNAEDPNEMLDKTRVMMEECNAALVFFTESYARSSINHYNTNVAFELGYLMSSEKYLHVFRHKSVDPEGFSLLSGWDIEPYDTINELNDQFLHIANGLLQINLPSNVFRTNSDTQETLVLKPR